ncbi:MAG: YjbQ family protein [Acidobacteria bacterium]|nr:MAG: YjbQ family protein [Acidobacteriota bacterium]
MAVETKRISLNTRGRDDICNITDEVARAVRSSRISSGVVTVFVPHSTAGITTIEYESGAVADLSRVIRRLIPEDPSYEHNRIDDNAHSHLRAAVIGPSVTVPFVNKELVLGTWQQIVLCDFDTHSRRRQVILQIVGD